MKQSEVKHILDTTSEVEEKEIVFTHYIDSSNGDKSKSSSHPRNYGNVKHLTGNLYYAHDDCYKDQGGVFVGEFQ